MTFRNKIVAGFGIALATLIFVSVSTYLSLARNGEDRLWVTHTHLVKETLDATASDIISAESGQRGYIITGEPSYLEPYRDILARLRGDLKELRSLTSDNPTQQHSLDRLEPLIAAKEAELDDRIDMRNRRGLEAGIAGVREGSGKQYMEEINAQIAEMQEEENRLLTVRSAEAEASSRSVKIIVLAGNIFALTFLCLAGIVIRTEMARRARAEHEVQSLNTDLEKRIEERTAELAERAKDLARSNTELQQFAYVASHDLQEPLRMVASFTQLLGRRYKDKLDKEAQEFIAFAVDGATRMQTLISDLLTFSRVGTQGKPLEPTDSGAILSQVLASLKLAIEESGAKILHDKLPIVMADPPQLGQLFQNLITNAIKFRGDEAPRIQISAERNGSDWKFAIRDTGIGIAPEHNERIFVIFQRLHTKADYPGTGIGLAISKKIVERHGGRIWVESSPGQGAKFCFTMRPAEIQMTEEREENGLHTSVSAY